MTSCSSQPPLLRLGRRGTLGRPWMTSGPPLPNLCDYPLLHNDAPQNQEDTTVPHPEGHVLLSILRQHTKQNQDGRVVKALDLRSNGL